MAAQTVQLLLDLAFSGLGLNKVQLQVYKFNQAGMRASQKAGCKEIGRRRRAQFMGGRFWDVICMDCLAEEFSSPVLSQVCTPDEAR